MAVESALRAPGPRVAAAAKQKAPVPIRSRWTCDPVAHDTPNLRSREAVSHICAAKRRRPMVD